MRTRVSDAAPRAWLCAYLECVVPPSRTTTAHKVLHGQILLRKPRAQRLHAACREEVSQPVSCQPECSCLGFNLCGAHELSRAHRETLLACAHTSDLSCACLLSRREGLARSFPCRALRGDCLALAPAWVAAAAEARGRRKGSRPRSSAMAADRRLTAQRTRLGQRPFTRARARSVTIYDSLAASRWVPHKQAVSGLRPAVLEYAATRCLLCQPARPAMGAVQYVSTMLRKLPVHV